MISNDILNTITPPTTPTKEPSPFTPTKRIPIRLDEAGRIRGPLSPGHDHPAVYAWEGEGTVLVGATGNRVSAFLNTSRKVQNL